MQQSRYIITTITYGKDLVLTQANAPLLYSSIDLRHIFDIKIHVEEILGPRVRSLFSKYKHIGDPTVSDFISSTPERFSDAFQSLSSFHSHKIKDPFILYTDQSFRNSSRIFTCKLKPSPRQSAKTQNRQSPRNANFCFSAST